MVVALLPLCVVLFDNPQVIIDVAETRQQTANSEEKQLSCKQFIKKAEPNLSHLLKELKEKEEQLREEQMHLKVRKQE